MMRDEHLGKHTELVIYAYYERIFSRVLVLRYRIRLSICDILRTLDARGLEDVLHAVERALEGAPGRRVAVLDLQARLDQLHGRHDQAVDGARVRARGGNLPQLQLLTHARLALEKVATL